MGFGFRCGFLGCCIWKVQERLEREYNLDLIITAPSVVYWVTTVKGLYIDNPSTLPSPNEREKIEEPYVQVDMITEEYVGTLMELCQNRYLQGYGVFDPRRTTLSYELPLAEVVTDFFDHWSRSRGYASIPSDWLPRESLVRLDLLINNDPVDPSP